MNKDQFCEVVQNKSTTRLKIIIFRIKLSVTVNVVRQIVCRQNPVISVRIYDREFLFRVRDFPRADFTTGSNW